MKKKKTFFDRCNFFLFSFDFFSFLNFFILSSHSFLGDKHAHFTRA